VRNPFGAEMWSSNWALAHSYFKLNEPATGDHDTCVESFSSAHPGGAFFAFCDGSVSFISDDVDFNNITNDKDCWYTTTKPCKAQDGALMIGVYQRLAWRNDGLVTDNGS
jgi:prepilin-type processing-associated H-X9-DG protein